MMRKRLKVLTALLKEIEARPCTDERDDVIAALQEVINEHEWEYSSSRKYVGTISSYSSNNRTIEKIEFNTAAGRLLFNVAYDNLELQEFIETEDDVIRHKRYDISLNTDLIAHVKGTTLEKLEWKVKWNPDAPEKWFCTGEAEFQYCIVIHEGEGIYEFIQPISYNESVWKISNELVALQDHPRDHIRGLQKQLECDGTITEGMTEERKRLLLAKALFEHVEADHDGCVAGTSYTWEGAIEKIAKKIGLENSTNTFKSNVKIKE